MLFLGLVLHVFYCLFSGLLVREVIMAQEIKGSHIYNSCSGDSLFRQASALDS